MLYRSSKNRSRRFLERDEESDSGVTPIRTSFFVEVSGERPTPEQVTNYWYLQQALGKGW